MSSPRRALRLRVGAAVTVPIVLAAALAAVWVLDQRAAARTRADSDVRATVAGSVTIVRTDLRNQLAAAAAGSQPGDAVVRYADLDHASLSRAVAVTARDGGEAMLDDLERVPSIVAPVYRGGTTPTGTARRRAAIESFRVVPLSMQPVLRQLVPEVGGLTVRGPNREIASNPRPHPGGARTYTVDMDITGSPGWVVQAWRPDPGVPLPAWLAALALLLLGGGAGALAGRLVRREQRAGARQRLLEQDRAVVTGLAPVLQTSVDIGEVIPAVCSHLASGLGLSGLSLSTPNEGGERQLFVWGVTPDAATLPRAVRPVALPPGETFAVALTRAGRALGVLRVVSAETLTADRLVSLGTAAELLGSTLANAEAFARQQDALARMRSVDELKTVFLATASHELRTPVTAIVGFSSLLLDQWSTMPPERARGLLDRVMSNGRRLDALIEQLLDFSRLERGLPQPGSELLNLGATVARILDDQAELAAAHHLDVVVETECLVRGSASSVERVVTNLVGNAAKYAPPGTRITVTIRTQGETALLVVDDEGLGIPEDDRERVFSRFYRGRGDAVTRTRGAGIGLAIVAEYAGSMSGSVRAERAPGGGARFVVSLPNVALVPTAPLAAGRLDVTVP